MDEERIIENAIKLGEKKKSTEVLKKSLHLFLPTKHSCVRCVVFLIFELILACFVAQNADTIFLEEKIITLFHDIIIALFGIIFTGYALFQALISDKLLFEMIKQRSDKEEYNSYIEESNGYFAEVMMAQFLVIIIDLIIRIFVGILPDQWVLFKNNMMNETFAGALIVVSIYLNVEVIWETKSFIFNMFQLFNGHAMARVIDMINKSKNEL